MGNAFSNIVLIFCSWDRLTRHWSRMWSLYKFYIQESASLAPECNFTNIFPDGIQCYLLLCRRSNCNSWLTHVRDHFAFGLRDSLKPLHLPQLVTPRKDHINVDRNLFRYMCRGRRIQLYRYRVVLEHTWLVVY